MALTKVRIRLGYAEYNFEKWNFIERQLPTTAYDSFCELDYFLDELSSLWNWNYTVLFRYFDHTTRNSHFILSLTIFKLSITLLSTKVISKSWIFEALSRYYIRVWQNCGVFHIWWEFLSFMTEERHYSRHAVVLMQFRVIRARQKPTRSDGVALPFCLLIMAMHMVIISSLDYLIFPNISIFLYAQ